jgi:hypothetical protein
MASYNNKKPYQIINHICPYIAKRQELLHSHLFTYFEKGGTKAGNTLIPSEGNYTMLSV